MIKNIGEARMRGIGRIYDLEGHINHQYAWGLGVTTKN